MEGINFNKKFILMILLMTILFSIFFISSVSAEHSEQRLIENAEFYDTEGNKIGIKLYEGEYLYVHDEKEDINNVFYKMTVLGTNSVFIKANALDFENYITRELITNKATYLYDSNENIIGQIDKGVKLDTALNEGDVYYQVLKDGLIIANKLQPDAGQVGDLSQEGDNIPMLVDDDNEPGNVITVIVKGILKFLFEKLPKMFINLFNT